MTHPQPKAPSVSEDRPLAVGDRIKDNDPRMPHRRTRLHVGSVPRAA
jgi:hypothetical protein